MAGSWSLPTELTDPPARSLGWVLLDWIEHYLVVPFGPMAGEPLQLVGYQVENLVRWYQVDERGRFVYRRDVLQLAKGKGKSPYAAALALAEFCGPVEFDGWDADGMPVGRPRRTTWVQCAAISLKQVDNMWRAAQLEIVDSALERDVPGWDPGTTRMHWGGGRGLLEPVTASAGTRIGQPITAAFFEETQGWTPMSGGVELAGTIRDNATKAGGRVVEITNAYEPGVGCVAESSQRAHEAGDRRILFVNQTSSRRVADVKDRDELTPALTEIYADAPWIDVETIVDDCLAPDKTALKVRRFFLNEVLALESRLVNDRTLAERAVDVELEPGAPIALGFDGSKTRDATALVGVDLRTGAAYLLGLWERPAGAREWEVPRDEVIDRVELIHEVWRVEQMACDPSWWRQEVAWWQQRWDKDRVTALNVSSPVAADQAIEATQAAFDSGGLTISQQDVLAAAPAGQQDLIRHLVSAQVAVSGAMRKQLVKPTDGRRIDAAAALVYAQLARVTATQRGWTADKAEDDWGALVMFG